LADPPGNNNGKKTALGNLLRDYRGQVLDGRKLDRTDNKRPKWRVVNLEARDTKASAGSAKPMMDMAVLEMPDALA
jgi:hypothetical protein